MRRFSAGVPSGFSPAALDLVRGTESRAALMARPGCGAPQRGRGALDVPSSQHDAAETESDQLAQTSPGSVLSLRGSSIPGSPAAAIVARVEDGVIGYKDLAALPRDKAILDIERPDLMIYQPHYSYSPLERSLSPRSISPPPSPENLSKEWLENRSPGGSSPSSTIQTSRTHSTHTPPTPHTPNTPNIPNTHTSGAKSAVQHFHRPKTAPTSTRSLRSTNKIQSNLGKIILKEELEKSAAPLRRKTRSLPDRSQNTGSKPSKSVYFPASSKTGLSRLQSAEFSSSEKTAAGLQNGDSRMDRGNSLPSMLEHKIFPYEMLVVTHRGRSKLPPGVDRTRLEVNKQEKLTREANKIS
ncbi:hypothetical protein INR49_018841 [Caranx melampygus]|nr:hypothetical protein INR49_018841 [Caranx melampygus]